MASIQSLSFIPTSISGCSLWLDGADPLATGSAPANGSFISIWSDKSGNGRNATTSTSANPPTYSFLDRCLQFRAASTQSLTIAQAFGNALVNTFYTILIVGRRQASGYQAFLSGVTLGLNENALLGYLGSTTTMIDYYGNNVNGTVSAYSAPDPVRILGFESLSTQRQIVLNGTLNATGSAVFLSSYTSPEIGRRYGGSVSVIYHDIDVFEMVAYVPNLSTAQRQQVEGYLAWKWGLQGSLPTSHPYYYMPPNSQGLPVPPLIRSQMTPRAFGSASLPLAFLNPTSIGNCILWLDAADSSKYTLSGSSLVSWLDKSSSGYTCTPVSGNVITTSNVNGLNVFFLNSTRLNIPSFVWSFQYTLFFVTRTANASFLYSQQTGGGYSNYVFTGNDGLQNINNTLTLRDSVIAQGTPVVSSNVYSIFSIGYSSGTSASNYAVNGTTRSTSVLSGTAVSPGSATSLLYLNGNLGGAVDSTYIAEILQYNTSITTAQRQQIEGYLAWKWGLQGSLPVSHPFKTSIPGLTLNVPIFASGMQNGSFSPLRLSGATMRLWMDATDSSTLGYSGSNINTWTDKANGVVFTTVGTASNLTLSTAINGRQSLYFNNTAADSVTMTGSLSNLLVGSAFYVFQAISQRNNNYRPFLTWNVGPPGGQFPSYGYLGNTVNNLTVGPYTTNASPNGTPTQVLTAGSNYFAFYGWSNTVTNVGYFGATPTIGSQQSYASTSNLCQIAGEYALSNGACLTAYMGEILLYNTILTTTQRQQVEGYLAWKWGLQGNLPATHPFSKFPPPPN